MRAARRAGNTHASSAITAITRGTAVSVNNRRLRRPTAGSPSADRAGARRPGRARRLRRSAPGHAARRREYVARPRAERQPDADLVAALGDDIVHDAVDADPRQQHGGRREDTEQQRTEAVRRDGVGGQRFQRRDIGDGNVRIEARDFAAQRLGEASRDSRARVPSRSSGPTNPVRAARTRAIVSSSASPV